MHELEVREEGLRRSYYYPGQAWPGFFLWCARHGAQRQLGAIRSAVVVGRMTWGWKSPTDP